MRFRGPSTGFCFLLAAVFLTGSFLSWVAKVGWYDVLFRSEVAEERWEAQGRYAKYLEKVALRTSNVALKKSALQGAIDIRKRRNETEILRRDEELLEALMPAKSDAFELTGCASDGWTLGTNPCLVTLFNRSSRSVIYGLRLGYWKDNSSMPITVSVTGDELGEKLIFAEARWETLAVEVPAESDLTLTVAADQSFSPSNDSRHIGVHVKVIAP